MLGNKNIGQISVENVLNLNTDMEEIYTDFSFIHENESDITNKSSSEQSQNWGVYSFKPVTQVEWDKSVAEAANQVMDNFPLQ